MNNVNSRFARLGLAATALLATAQPCLALTVGVCGIDNYTANGTPYNDLYLSVFNANNFKSRAVSHGWTSGLIANDSNAYGSVFVNSGLTGMCAQDMGYFAGHSDYRGPFLGAGTAYSNNGASLVTVPANYNWSSYNLKWMVAGPACEWLYDGVTTNTTPNWYTGTLALSRWFKAFDWTYGSVPSGSLHAIIAHRADTFDIGDIGSTYVDNCLGTTNSSVGQGWYDANYTQEYLNGAPGIEPALLCAYQTSTSANWFYEKLTSPYLNPRNCANMNYMFNWNFVGSPQF